MNSNTELALTFLDSAPGVAAEEIQRMPSLQSAAFIDSVPPRASAPVLTRMIPWNAARLLEAVKPTRAAAILRQLDFSDAVSLLRLTSPDVRERIAGKLPARVARRMMSALRYPHHQVGAWVDPEIPTLCLEDLVGDALRILGAADVSSHVFLETQRHGEYCGAVSVWEILRADPALRMGELERINVTPVSNRDSLSSVAFDARWDKLIHLPVVGQRGNILGGLSRKSLREAMHEPDTAAARADVSWLRELIVAYAVACQGVAELVTKPFSDITAANTGGSKHER